MTVSDIQDSHSLMLFGDNAAQSAPPQRLLIAVLRAWIGTMIPPERHPTSVLVAPPASVSVRNAALQRLSVQLLPAFVQQDSVLFLPGCGDAITLYPDGTFRARQVGVSRVYVVPTDNCSAYRAVDVTVRPALVRRTGSGGIRRTGAGKLRIS